MSRACFENRERDLDSRLEGVTDWTGASYSGYTCLGKGSLSPLTCIISFNLLVVNIHKTGKSSSVIHLTHEM